MPHKITIGDSAPDFKLYSQEGKVINLHKFKNKKAVVLFFYPKDGTPGCTAEVCSFRDSYDVFKKDGVEVIGISSDTTESHKVFAVKNNLPFVLLSDDNNKVRKLYGVPKTLGLLPGRVTYIIDKKGIVRHIFSSQLNSTKHVTEALKILKTLTL